MDRAEAQVILVIELTGTWWVPATSRKYPTGHTWTQNVQQRKPLQFRKAIARMTAMRPLARAHKLSFISGGGVHMDLGLLGISRAFSRWFSHTRKMPTRITPMMRRAMISRRSEGEQIIISR
jgi:hypothetical protein